MNSNFKHPKLGGYQVTPRAHLFVNKRFRLKGLLNVSVSSERSDLADEISMGNDHSAAAVTVKTHIVEDFLRVLAHLDTLNVLGVG